MGATVAQLVIPVLTFVANVIDVLLNKLGPLSSILRFLATGLLSGGVIKAFGVFGRAPSTRAGLSQAERVRVVRNN